MHESYQIRLKIREQGKESLLVWNVVKNKKINGRTCSDFFKLCLTEKCFTLTALGDNMIKTWVY